LWPILELSNAPLLKRVLTSHTGLQYYLGKTSNLLVFSSYPYLSYDSLTTYNALSMSFIIHTFSSAPLGVWTPVLLDVLHWLPYPLHIVYRVAAFVRHCIEGLAPPYLHCCPTVAIKRHISLRSSPQAELLVPHTWTVIRQHRTFFVAGLTA